MNQCQEILLGPKSILPPFGQLVAAVLVAGGPHDTLSDQSALAIQHARQTLCSRSLFWGREGLCAELDALAADCSEPNWDGYEALPISPVALERAKCLVRAIPQDLPAPSISPEPDGAIGLDWYATPSRVCSVGCCPDGTFNYAALLDDDTATGHFSGMDEDAFPSVLSALINKVLFNG